MPLTVLSVGGGETALVAITDLYRKVDATSPWSVLGQRGGGQWEGLRGAEPKVATYLLGEPPRPDLQIVLILWGGGGLATIVGYCKPPAGCRLSFQVYEYY